jgi:hypothetical protein
MRIPWRILYHFLVIPLFVLLLTGAQSSLWFHVLGLFPTPQLWIVALTYLIIHRSFWLSLSMGYLFAVLMTGFTAWPFENLLATSMVIVGSSQLLKDRIYGSGANYFIALCGWNVFLFHLCYTFLGFVTEDISFSRVSLFDLSLSPLLSMLLAYPVYFAFKLLDRLFKEDEEQQSGKSLI